MNAESNSVRKFYILAPEVAGGRGDQTLADLSVHPPIVRRLHYEFDGWLGDELLESFPVFIVTERLAQRIQEKNASGVEFEKVIITKSELFRDLQPDLELPPFVWLKPVGKVAHDDFGVSSDHRLVVS